MRVGLRFCPNTSKRTTGLNVGDDKVRLKLQRGSWFTVWKPDGRKQAWRQSAQIRAHPGKNYGAPDSTVALRATGEFDTHLGVENV